MRGIALFLEGVNVFLLTMAALAAFEAADAGGSVDEWDIEPQPPAQVMPGSSGSSAVLEPIPWEPTKPAAPGGASGGGLPVFVAFFIAFAMSWLLVWAIWVVIPAPLDGRVERSRMFAMLILFGLSAMLMVMAWVWNLTATPLLGP